MPKLLPAPPQTSSSDGNGRRYSGHRRMATELSGWHNRSLRSSSPEVQNVEHNGTVAATVPGASGTSNAATAERGEPTCHQLGSNVE